jgi:signal transduction histidine kinase
MNEPARNGGAPTADTAGSTRLRGSLFRKYVVLLLILVSVTLLASGMIQIWFSYQEHRTSLVHVQHEQAKAAASRIGEYIKEIQEQLGWTTQLPWSLGALEERRFDALRLLRQVPAITELVQVDSAGREQLRVSRLALDVVGSQADFSKDRKYTAALANKVYYGPVYFRRESEPYMTLALAGARRDAGVSMAEVNLKLIWDIVSQIKVGKSGYAYVVDAQGRLIAHPDISLVLRNTDLSQLSHVQAARAGDAGVAPSQGHESDDIQGRRVLTAHAPIAPLNWLVFVNLPLAEAYAPLYASMTRSAVLLLAGLGGAFLAALFLARKMVVPIRALRASAARIGSGDLGQRISIKSGDELEALAHEFNEMTGRLQASYADLEKKVEIRTRELEEKSRELETANLAKSRFLAVASHDLRQPLHALGLFAAQLHAPTDATERAYIVGRIETALGDMNELFNDLLDISKLDAGILSPNRTEFPLKHLFERIETNFAGPARQKGLLLRVVPSAAWVRSDAILLERILLNLVSNAIRYTAQGRVIVGCRRRGDMLRIEICDTGPGIPEDQQRNVFGEFYQLPGVGRDRHGGLGLGLAIVDRLCRLLDHPVELTSTVGKGSRFAVVVPSAVVQARAAPAAQILADAASGKLIVVIDDDTMVLEGMRGLLRGWGCKVVTAGSEKAAMAGLGEQRPDLIISDYRIGDGFTGIDVIERLRVAFGPTIPAFLISGDIAAERLREARASGYHLLHKPVQPMALRAMLSQLLKPGDARADC